MILLAVQMIEFPLIYKLQLMLSHKKQQEGKAVWIYFLIHHFLVKYLCLVLGYSQMLPPHKRSERGDWCPWCEERMLLYKF